MTDCPHGAAVGNAAAAPPAFAEQSCIQGTGDGEPLEAAPAPSRALLHRLGAKQTTDRKPGLLPPGWRRSQQPHSL